MRTEILKCFSKALHVSNVTRNFYAVVLLNPNIQNISITNKRFKHWNPKFKKERAAKVIKVKLPDYDELRRDENLSIEEMRSKLKEKGIAPTRSWNEKPMYISCTGDIIDPYVPPEGDGKISVVSGPGMKQMYETIGKKGKSYMALRKIRNLDYDFDLPTVAMKMQDIYVQAQMALAEKNEDRLHELVSEKAFPEMMENVKNKSIVWRFIQELEPPRVVHIRVEDLLSKGNLFGQITCRLHTQQTLAVYDRFGRLMYGSEDTVKDVLEYVVMEKYLTSTYGEWRIHAKIIPDWMPPKQASGRTFLMPDLDKEFPEPPQQDTKEVVEKKEDATVATA